MSDYTDKQKGVEKAIEAAGSQAELARKLDISKAAVGKWVKAGAIPVERVPAVADALGLDRSVLRPDFWPPAEEAAA